MDFYRLKKPGSEWLTRQGDVIKAARAEKAEWEKIEVPTSKKEEMQAWLNANARGGAPAPSVEPAAATEDHSLDEHLPHGVDPVDGHPKVRSAFTSAQVHASALPRSTKVQDVCHIISTMPAGELGFVALEVIARGAKLGGVV
jgi:hypothetical protein